MWQSLRKEMRSREEQVVRQIIHQRDIVLATNVGAATKVRTYHLLLFRNIYTLK